MNNENIEKLSKILELMNERLKVISDMIIDNQKAIISIAELQQSIARLIQAKNN